MQSKGDSKPKGSSALDKATILTRISWARHVLGLLAGLACGILGITGFVGVAIFAASNILLVLVDDIAELEPANTGTGTTQHVLAVEEVEARRLQRGERGQLIRAPLCLENRAPRDGIGFGSRMAVSSQSRRIPSI